MPFINNTTFANTQFIDNQARKETPLKIMIKKSKFLVNLIHNKNYTFAEKKIIHGFTGITMSSMIIFDANYATNTRKILIILIT